MRPLQASAYRIKSDSVAWSGSVRLVFHPLPEQLVAHRQHHWANKQANDAAGHHAAQRTDEYHRHRHVDATA